MSLYHAATSEKKLMFIFTGVGTGVEVMGQLPMIIVGIQFFNLNKNASSHLL